MIAEVGVYGGLFLASLIAATILPMQSEAALVGLILTGHYPVWLLLLVASCGNILGSVINWLLGRGIDHYRDRPWFPANAEKLARAGRWYRRYGKWSLLFAWLPIIGDPLTVVAGVLREPFWPFLALVSTGKFARYAVLAMMVV
jgi:membrane protein YqaA with SNARE-associated domain